MSELIYKLTVENTDGDVEFEAEAYAADDLIEDIGAFERAYIKAQVENAREVEYE